MTAPEDIWASPAGDFEGVIDWTGDEWVNYTRTDLADAAHRAGYELARAQAAELMLDWAQEAAASIDTGHPSGMNVAREVERDTCKEAAETIRALPLPTPAELLSAALELPEIKAMSNKWQPIDTAPYKKPVDLWCIYGGEEFARYDGGASVGKFVPDRYRSPDYEWFGNQSNSGVPQGGDKDLIPVAWRYAAPMCPSDLIAKVMGIPLDRAEALAALEAKHE